MPVGTAAEPQFAGLPTAVQVVAPPNDEDMVLAVSRAVEVALCEAQGGKTSVGCASQLRSRL